MGEVDSIRRRAEGYLVGLVARYGELEGPGAATTVCHQFGITPRALKQQGDKALPAAAGNQPQHSHGQSMATSPTAKPATSPTKTP